MVMLTLVFIGLILLNVNGLDNRFTAPKQPTSSDSITTMRLEAKKQNLLEKINAYAKEHDIKPIDATIDRVWKAIPGYNGLSVDVEASYSKLKTAEKFRTDQLIYKETQPQVHLRDLPPSPIYKGNSEKPMVALLINVAWGNEFIPKILDVLDKNEVNATFFFDGSWVKKNPDLAKMIYKANHEIGNHAYSHPDLQQKSKGETRDELQKTNDVIEETIGLTPIWFAPPSGSFNQATIDIARELDMLTILWTVDTVDWKKPGTTEMVSRVLSQVDSGSMILMHPTKPTAEGLEKMITAIKAKGLHLGTVSEIMSADRLTNEDEDFTY